MTPLASGSGSGCVAKTTPVTPAAVTASKVHGHHRAYQGRLGKKPALTVLPRL